VSETIHTINGKNYTVAELKVKQYQRLVGLLSKLQVGKLLQAGLAVQNFFETGGGAQTNVDIEAVLAAIDDEAILQQFLALCVVPEGGAYDPQALDAIAADMGEADIEQAAEILKSFFALNERSARRALGILGVPGVNGAAKPAKKAQGRTR